MDCHCSAMHTRSECAIHWPLMQRSLERDREWRRLESTVVAAYCDGGVISANPSKIGGTWAWCHVNAWGERIRTASGFVPANPNGKPITNNNTEMIAMVLLLESLPNKWSGPLYCDSELAIGWTFKGYRTKNVPSCIIDRMMIARLRAGDIRPIHLSGHPTKNELLNGISKEGRPVSEHNQWCDEECSRVAARVLRIREEIVAARDKPWGILLDDNDDPKTPDEVLDAMEVVGQHPLVDTSLQPDRKAVFDPATGKDVSVPSNWNIVQPPGSGRPMISMVRPFGGNSPATEAAIAAFKKANPVIETVKPNEPCSGPVIALDHDKAHTEEQRQRRLEQEQRLTGGNPYAIKDKQDS